MLPLLPTRKNTIAPLSRSIRGTVESLSGVEFFFLPEDALGASLMHDAGPAEQVLSHRHDLFNLFTVLELLTDFPTPFRPGRKIEQS